MSRPQRLKNQMEFFGRHSGTKPEPLTIMAYHEGAEGEASPLWILSQEPSPVAP